MIVIREIKRNIFLGKKKKKKTYINMKICRGRKKKSIFDTKGLREGKGWGKGRDIYVLVIEKGICNQQVV